MRAILQNAWVTSVESELEAAELAMDLDKKVRSSLDAGGHTDALASADARYLGSTYIVFAEAADA